MKLFKLAALITLLTLFTTGCSINSESPEQLIKNKPLYDEDKSEIYDLIKEKHTRYLESLLPANSKEVGLINEVDLNQDGVDEIVAFEKKENVNENKTEVGFMVLTNNMDGTYTDKGSLLREGTSIEYANFYDLNSDGYLEIVLLVKNQDKTNMYIYEFKEDKINLIYELNTTWIPDRNSLTDMKVEIGYFDKDDTLDVLALNYNPSKNTVYASVINFGEDINLRDSTEIENVKNFSSLYTTVGNVSKNKIGIVLDIPTLQDSYYITQILYIDNGKIKKAFKDDDERSKKSYYLPVEDINNDNILEIPIANGNNNMYSLKSSANVSWYRWNGKEGEESDLVFTIQIYYNYQYNFKLLIPNNLVNKFYIEQDNSKSDNVVFKFNYFDMVTSETKNIFTISVTPKSSVEDSKNISATNGILLGESYDYTFTLYQNYVEILEQLNLTSDALRDYFSLIH
ncbi:MAG: FG-GAP repeat domain-containing protein [Peptostreptococcaceae bacterium]